MSSNAKNRLSEERTSDVRIIAVDDRDDAVDDTATVDTACHSIIDAASGLALDIQYIALAPEGPEKNQAMADTRTNLDTIVRLARWIRMTAVTACLALVAGCSATIIPPQPNDTTTAIDCTATMMGMPVTYDVVANRGAASASASIVTPSGTWTMGGTYLDDTPDYAEAPLTLHANPCPDVCDQYELELDRETLTLTAEDETSLTPTPIPLQAVKCEVTQ